MDAADLVAIAVLVSVCATASVPVIAASSSGAGPDTAAGAPGLEPVSLQEPTNESNETTTHHRNPDAVDETGDIREALIRRMAQRVKTSSVNISRRQYDQARAALGEEYESYIAKYTGAASETETPSDDEKAAALRRIQLLQQTYVNATEEYDRTLERFRYVSVAERPSSFEAPRTRHLARDLIRLSNRIRTLTRELNRTYTTAGNLTGIDYSDTKQQLDNTTANVTRTVHDIRQSVFVGTTLRVRSLNGSASITDPAVVVGRLSVEENASPPETVELVVGGQRFITPVGANGSIRFEYRPTSLRTGYQPIRVTYRPKNTSIYRNATDNVTLYVAPGKPTIDVETATRGVGVGDELRVAGTVRADGATLSNVSLQIRVDGGTIATVRTDDSGRFDVSTPFPSWVESGNRALTLVAGRNRTAIERQRVTLDIRVRETETELSMDVIDRTESSVAVRGQLTTDDGVGLPNQSVSITAANSTVATVVTAANGTFATEFSLPERRSGETVNLSASLESSGTSLVGSTARTSVTVPGRNSGHSGLPIVPLGGGMLIIAGGIVVVYYLQSGVPDLSTTGSESSTAAEDSAASGTTDGRIEAVDLEDRDFDAEGAPTAATIRAYAELRRVLGMTLGVTDGATHWEVFERAIEDRDGLREELYQVTAAYELAAFAPEEIDPERARRAVEAARDVAGSLDGVSIEGKGDGPAVRTDGGREGRE